MTTCTSTYSVRNCSLHIQESKEVVRMPLQTTVIGSWPKPSYLRIPDWFSQSGNFTDSILSQLTGMGGGYDPRSRPSPWTLAKDGDEELECQVRKAVGEVLKEQADLGIEVVTDGEMERGAYYMQVMSNIK